MPTKPIDPFDESVYNMVTAIPPGKVCSYGRIAMLLGHPGLARRVGRAMAGAPPGVPAHRVVNAQGRTAPGFTQQRALLEREGVRFKPNGCVDMRAHCIR